jgi:outer membrane beta-barrel protein
MTMTKRILFAVVLVSGLVAVDGPLGLGTPSVAEAQDIQITGPLAGAPACRRCRIYREGRIQLQPTFSFTLQDEYSRAILFGLQANYHITDWLGIGIWGGYAPLEIDTSLTSQIKERGQTTNRNVLSLPSAAAFGDQVARFQGAAALQLTFVPLRGKLSLFQQVFVDADFYIFAGAAGVLIEERAPVASSEGCTVANVAACRQTEREGRFDITWTAGVGLMLMANQFFGLSFEWRALPFAWNTSGTDERNAAGESFPDEVIDGNDAIYRLNHMVSIGLAFYLPTEARITD